MDSRLLFFSQLPFQIRVHVYLLVIKELWAKIDYLRLFWQSSIIELMAECHMGQPHVGERRTINLVSAKHTLPNLSDESSSSSGIF